MRKFLVFMMLISCAILAAQQQYVVYRTSDGAAMDAAHLATALSDFDVIFFGEYHDDAILHEIELTLLQELVQAVPSLAVSMEMFERDTQDVLDAYLDGRMEEKEFIELSRAWPNYLTDYKPLIEFAKERSLPVIAANIPRRYAAKVRTDGWKAVDTVPLAERRWIARELKVINDAYREKFIATMQANMGSHGMPGASAMFDALYRAQSLKDDTMAESINDFITAHPGVKVIHYNGDFHSNSHLGTAQKLALLNPQLSMAVLTPALVDLQEPLAYDSTFATEGDFVIVMHRAPTEADAQAMFQRAPVPQKHSIEVELDPQNHALYGRDTIHYLNQFTSADTLYMHKDLRVYSIKSGENDVPYVTRMQDQYLVISLTPTEPIDSLTIIYEGSVYTPLRGRSAKQHHDYTSGMISGDAGEGIYLPPASWYPQCNNDPLMHFNVKSLIPREFTLVTSGTGKRELRGEMRFASWTTEHPTDGLTLVGNRFEHESRAIDGIELNTFLSADNAGKATLFLDAMEEYYRSYTALFGDYPHSSFALVENFFASGFGMPGYTVIAPQLIQMPHILLSPGALAHEFVHGWWGNGVYVDYQQGNWCEALTVFSTNYYWHMIQQDAIKAQQWRQDAQMNVNLLQPAKQFPLREFITQYTEDDAVIGYDKGAFLFVQLHRLMGSDAFFAAVRNFYKTNIGQEVGWPAVQDAFAQGPHQQQIDLLFTLWLDETTLPRLSVELQSQSEDGVRLHITQQQPVFPLMTDIQLRTADGLSNHNFMLDAADTTLVVDCQKVVLDARLDPACFILKQLDPSELPTMLQRTLTDSILCILPQSDSLYTPFTHYISTPDLQIHITDDKAYKKRDWKSTNLLVMGTMANNKLLRKLAARLPDGFKVKKGSFSINDVEYSDPGDALLISVQHPYDDAKFVTLYIANDLNTPFSPRRILHYKQHSWVVFEAGMKMGSKPQSGTIFGD